MIFCDDRHGDIAFCVFIVYVLGEVAILGLTSAGHWGVCRCCIVRDKVRRTGVTHYGYHSRCSSTRWIAEL